MRACTAFLVLAAACGDNLANTTPDASQGVAPDGPTAGFAPVPTKDQPQVEKGPGTQLVTPKIVPIFFTGDDAIQAQTEQFLMQLASSPYWHTTTSEYGVGALTIAQTIVETSTPPTTDAALQTLIAQRLSGASPAWGTLDPQAIYAVFLPSGVVLDTGFGKSCQAFGAYHDEVTQQGAPNAVYALMPRCSGLDELTVATSHELVEAATDPHPETMTAWGDHMDGDHLVWEFTPGAELGDMCEYVHAAPQRLVGSFLVQRTWSNKSIARGHDPCVPVMTTPYVVAIPQLADDLSLSDGMGGTIMTKGVAIPVGMSKTIEVDLFSDAPADPFQVKAIDASTLQGQTGELTLSLDHDMGSPGDKLMLTITRNKAGVGGSEFVLSSRVNGGSVALFWGLVAD